jgi:hypothetical protein
MKFSANHRASSREAASDGSDQQDVSWARIAPILGITGAAAFVVSAVQMFRIRRRSNPEIYTAMVSYAELGQSEIDALE